MRNRSKDCKKNWAVFRRYLPFVLLFLPLPVEANGINSLKGHAHLEWAHKKKVYRFDEAVWIKNPGEGVFETLDDFGNTLLRLELGPSQTSLRLPGRLLRLPLSQAELLSTLLYRLPDDPEGLKAEYDRGGRLKGVEKPHRFRKKAYKISFFDLKKRGRILYPRVIEITSHKTKLRIEWQSVKVSRSRKES